jgi:hypothetical protein
MHFLFLWSPPRAEEVDMEPSVPLVTLLTQHFAPSRSPFLLITVSGVISATVVTLHDPLDRWYWLALVAPMMVTIAASAYFAYRSVPVAITGDKEVAWEDYQNQLRFSRAVCLATPLLCLAIFTLTLGDPKLNALQFWTNHATCVLQVAVFLVYVGARSIREEPESSTSKFGFAQFALLTSLMLISASYNLYRTRVLENNGLPEHIIRRYLLTVLLYMIWMCCLLFWADRVRRILQFSVSLRPEDGMDTARATPG